MILRHFFGTCIDENKRNLISMNKSILAIAALSLILFGTDSADAGSLDAASLSGADFVIAGSLSKSGRSVGSRQSSRSVSRSSRGSRGVNRRGGGDARRGGGDARRGSGSARGARNNRGRGGRIGGRGRGIFGGFGFPGRFGRGAGLFYPSPFYYGFRSRYCATCPNPPLTRSPVRSQLASAMKLELSLQSNQNDDQFTDDSFATHVAFSVGGPFVGIRLNHDQYNETVFDGASNFSETNNIGLWGAVITGRILQAPNYAVELEGGIGGIHSNLFNSFEGPKVGAALKFRPSKNVEVVGRGTHYYFSPTETNTGNSITVNDAELAAYFSYFKVGYRFTQFNFADNTDLEFKDGGSSNFSKSGPEVGLSFSF